MLSCVTRLVPAISWKRCTMEGCVSFKKARTGPSVPRILRARFGNKPYQTRCEKDSLLSLAASSTMLCPPTSISNTTDGAPLPEQAVTMTLRDAITIPTVDFMSHVEQLNFMTSGSREANGLHTRVCSCSGDTSRISR